MATAHIPEEEKIPLARILEIVEEVKPEKKECKPNLKLEDFLTHLIPSEPQALS